MPGAFVFGDNWLGNGLGDAAFFAVSCLHQPGVLTAPDTAATVLDGRYGGGGGGESVHRLVLSDLEDLNANVDYNLPDSCYVVEMEDLNELLGIDAAFCEGEDEPRSGEALFCVRPRTAKTVSCGSSAMYARVGSQVKQTLEVQHFSAGPPVRGEMGYESGESPPSGFYSFWGGCEVFVGKTVTCFGGNGAFGVLPFDHACGGLSGLANPRALSCAGGSSAAPVCGLVDRTEKQQQDAVTQPGLPPPSSPGVFVFGENWLGNGLGDAAYFAASCMHSPGLLTAPDAVDSDFPGAARLALSDLDDLNEKVDFTTNDLCYVVTMEDISGLLQVPMTCEKGDGESEGGARAGGEAIFCNRPLGPRVVDCSGSAMYARVGSSVTQTLEVEHYVSRPEPSSSSGRTVPSGFHSFVGGCEVFGDIVTCFGGNGQFGALPFDHRCWGGNVGESLKISCAVDSKPLECDDGSNVSGGDGSDSGDGNGGNNENVDLGKNETEGSSNTPGSGGSPDDSSADVSVDEPGEPDDGTNGSVRSGVMFMTTSIKVQAVFFFLCVVLFAE